MNANYRQKGDVLDYMATVAVKAGALVRMGTRVGVAGADIAAGETGMVHMVGVFGMDKATDTAITTGAAVYYDADDDVITTTATDNVPAGYAAAPAAAGDSIVYVKLIG